jgi:hypothetical protein
MHRSMIALATASLVAFAVPVAGADDPPHGHGGLAQPLMSGEHAAKIREEVRLHEQRAREIDPIVSRDRQARRDVEIDWVVLERHARELHARANEFRSFAGEQPTPRAQQDMLNFANELDTFAGHDEENARWQHEIADRLERAIQASVATRDWHLKMAQRLRDWLSQSGL